MVFSVFARTQGSLRVRVNEVFESQSPNSRYSANSFDGTIDRAFVTPGAIVREETI